MVVLYDHEVPTVAPAVLRDGANFRENFREATISATGEKARSQNSNQESGGPYTTRTYNQLIKRQNKRSGKSGG